MRDYTTPEASQNVPIPKHPKVRALTAAYSYLEESRRVPVKYAVKLIRNPTAIM